MLNWYLSTFSSRFHPVEGSGRGLFRYYTTSNFANVRLKNYLISGENLLQPWCQINGADGPNKSGEVALGEIWSNAAWISQPKVIFVMKVDIVIIITFVFISTEKVSVEHSIIVVSIHRAGGEEEGLP